MNVLKHIFTRKTTATRAAHKLYFQRATGRYAQKGSISSNQGYLAVGRDEATGRFTRL